MEGYKLYAIVGNPVKHSLSPTMYNAAFLAKKINAKYLTIETNDLHGTVKFFFRYYFNGFNITMPYKEKIIDYANSFSKEVEKIKAANTAKIIDKKIRLYNTDYFAAKKLIKNKIKTKNKKALIYGSGGVARAIAAAINDLKIDGYITARNYTKAKLISEDFKIEVVHNREIKKQNFDILINATPLGMKGSEKNPFEKKIIKNAELVYDCVYLPLETKLLREAKKEGCKTINGIEMLLEQGYEAFKIFTNKDPPKKIMRDAVIKELTKNGWK